MCAQVISLRLVTGKGGTMGVTRYNLDVDELKKTDFRLLYVTTSKYEGDWQSLPHTHHFTELFYVLNGTGNFLIEDRLFTVSPNDLVEHTEKSMNANPLEYIVFGIEGLIFTFDQKFENENFGLYNFSAEKNQLTYLLNFMLQEIQEKNPHHETICQNILEILILYINRTHDLGINTVPSSRMSKECAAAKRFLDANYAQNITLDTLVDVTHMNKYYLVHSFTKYTGLSPINYLIQKRVQASMDLLCNTNHSIAQIASSTGFASQSYFSQIFKKAVGLSPNQYRKRNSPQEQKNK